MPMSTIIILAAIVLAFTLFGTVLAWGDFYTQRARQANKQAIEPPAEESRFKDAA